MKKSDSESGFSLIEVVVAIVILSIGTLMLAGGSLFVTRDLVRSRQGSIATSMAAAQLNLLRTRAAATNPACTSGQFVSSAYDSVANHVTMKWVVANGGANREIKVITTYLLGRGRSRADTVATTVAC